MIKMRICGGQWRGRKIEGVEWEGTRPITDMIKENIFNLLGQTVYGDVLDLFAGSGSIGLEALSRGADYCHFNELNNNPLNILKRNIAIFDAETNVTKSDGFLLIKSLNRTFDFIFLDPPFPILRNEELLNEIFKMKLLNEGGKIILRISSNNKLSDDIPFSIWKEKKYGASLVYILEAK